LTKIHKTFFFDSQTSFVLQDAPKFNRCTELLSMNKEIKQVQKLFEADEENLSKIFEDESADG
jgi:transcription initiation factor TFIID subunit 13